MARMTLRGVLLLGIPSAALLVLSIVYLVRDDGGQREIRLREQTELEASIRKAQGAKEPANVSLERYRRALALGSPPSSDPVRLARADLLKQGEAVIPLMRTAIYNATESAALRIELIAMLGEMKGASAESLLVAILGDRTLEDRYRIVALSQIYGRPSEAAFPALQKMYLEEPNFSARHLMLRAIGATKDIESTNLLLEAAKKEQNPSARIEAVDSLVSRMEKPGAIALVRDVLLRDPEENVRLASLACLAKSPDPSVNATLQEVIDDPRSSAVLKKAATSWVERRKAN